MAGFRRRLDPGATAPEGGHERELDEEIRAHIEMRTAELIARGMSPEEARAEALRRFGDAQGARRRLLTGVRRRDRRRRWQGAGRSLASDACLAVRAARRSPAFAALSVGIFAAGVGLTTSMATVADHVLLRPLPYAEPDRLVALWSMTRARTAFPWVSMGNWVDWREGASVESTALYSFERGATVATRDDAFRARAINVAGAFFETLGNAALVGRTFTEEEAQAEADVTVVSEGFWRRVLGAAPVPSLPELRVDGRRVRIVGVVEQGAGFPSGAEIWMPERWRASTGGMRNNINYQAIARLRPDATLARARTELDAIAERIRTTDPEAIYSWGVGVRPLRDVVVGDARTYLVLLSVAVLFLLVVSCANLAGLGLARARRRTRETAVHLALGAGRWTLVRRAVVEHLLLAVVGGGLGVGLAWLATDALLTRIASVVPRADEIGFDARIAALGIAVALASGLLAGLLPALRRSWGDLSDVLSGARGSVTGGRRLPGAVMVGTEVALAVALLVGGALLVRSFRAVVARDLGFEGAGVAVAEVPLVGPEYADPDRRLAFWGGLLERAAGLPGMASVAVANAIPTGSGSTGFIDFPDREGENIGAGYRVVSDGYFEALGITLLAGRVFDASDAASGERVAVVSRSMATTFWPDGSPLGQRVRARSMESFPGTPAPWITVVGVVDDVRQFGFESDVRPDMYVLYRQVPYWTRMMTLIARARGAAPQPVALREAVRDLDPGLAPEVGSMEGRLAALTRERRLVLTGLGVFGAASVVLVCLGIYGLMSFAAGERTREMAVRVALGAGRGGIVGLMLGSAMRVVLVGGAVGLLTAWGFTRLLGGLLVDVAPTDPLSYGAAFTLLASVAALAALAPSVRAARRDPLDALNSEG